MKKTILLRSLALLMLCTVLLCSCAAKPETFSCEGMQIDLTNKFSELEQEGCTAIYTTRKEMVTVLKESFEQLSESGLNLNADSTPVQYARVVAEANALEDVKVQTRNEVICFVYENTADGTAYTYLATVHKSEDAFWLIQFAATSKDYAEREATFFEYAKSVRFS